MDRYSADSHCPDCFQPATADSGCEHCGFDARQAVDGAHYLAPFTPLHGGRYLLGRILGHPGAYGVVYAGWHQQLRREVAIKEFFPATAIAERSRDQRTVRARPGQQALFDRWCERFLNEARLLAGFEHAPRIVQVSDVFEENGSAYLVMERLRGEPLSQTLQLQASERGLQARHSLQVSEAELLFIALLEALSTLHQRQVLHRDISPGNLYLQGGQPAGLTLLDFGLARDADAGPVQTGSVGLGTPGFVAPEQLQRDGQPLGPWSDLYSAAAVLYLSLCGCPPPPANERASGVPLTPIRRLRPDLPQQLAEQIDHCLRLDPDRRPRSAAQVREQLAAATLMPAPAAHPAPPAPAADPTGSPPQSPPHLSQAASLPSQLSTTAAELPPSAPTAALHTGIALTASKPEQAALADAVPAIITPKRARRRRPRPTPSTDRTKAAAPAIDPFRNPAANPAMNAGTAGSQRGKRRQLALLMLLLLLGLGLSLWPTLQNQLKPASLPTGDETAETPAIPPAMPNGENGTADNYSAGEQSPVTVLPPKTRPAEVTLPGSPWFPASDTSAAPPGTSSTPRLATGRAPSPAGLTGSTDSTGPASPAGPTHQPPSGTPAPIRLPARLPTPADTTGASIDTGIDTEIDTGISTTDPVPAAAAAAGRIPSTAAAPTRPLDTAARPTDDPAEDLTADAASAAAPGSHTAASNPATERPDPPPPLQQRPGHAAAAKHPLPYDTAYPGQSPRYTTATPVLGHLPKPIPDSVRHRTTPLPPGPDSSEPSPLQRRQQQLATLPRQQRLQQVLSQLNFDLRNRRYITPADGNLLMDFELLRQLDPNHPQLHKAFWELVWFFGDATEEALELHDPTRATTLLQHARELAPDMQRWQQLTLELQRLKRHNPQPDSATAPATWHRPADRHESPTRYPGDYRIEYREADTDYACFGGEDCARLIDEIFDDRY